MNPRETASEPRDLHNRLTRIYRTLLARFGEKSVSRGPFGWWPGETPFEILVGAILTQQAAWTNVEMALANLKRAKLLEPRALAGADLRALEKAVRPTGFYRQKARRVKGAARWLAGLYGGDIHNLLSKPTGEARRELLSVKGIGPETADSILLYAGGHPLFVVDAYTVRVMNRLPLGPRKGGYDDYQAFFHRNLPADVPLFNRYHGLFVELGKNHCRPRPLCAGCPLCGLCRSGRKKGK